MKLENSWAQKKTIKKSGNNGKGKVKQLGGKVMSKETK